MLHSYDQHRDFVAATQEWLADHDLSAHMHHAPLGPAPGDWRGYWYQLSALPRSIGMLVVAGPPWTVHPHVRGAAEMLFDQIVVRSEEHTSELQSLMRISYAVFCLKKQKKTKT